MKQFSQPQAFQAGFQEGTFIMGQPVHVLGLTQIVNAKNAKIIANINASEAVATAPMQRLNNMLEPPPSPSTSQ